MRSVPAWLLTVALPLAGCGPELLRHEEEQSGRHAVPAGVAALDVDAGAAGSITVLGQPGAGEVTWTGLLMVQAPTGERHDQLRAAAPAVLAAEVDGDVLRLRAPRRPADHDEHSVVVVKVVVRCPPNLAVRLHTEVGHLKVDDIAAPVRLDTGRGDLSLARVDGDARLRSGAGAVVVDAHRGALAIEAHLGMVQAFVRELRAPGVDIESADSVQLHLPAAARFALDAVAEHGEAVNGFGVPVIEVAEHGWQMQREGGPGLPLVRVRSRRGNVSIVAD